MAPMTWLRKFLPIAFMRTDGSDFGRRVQRAISAFSIFLSCLTCVSPAQANLVVNGGFEDPVLLAGFAYEHRSGTALSGWTSISSYAGAVQFDSMLYAPVSEGHQAVQIEMPGDTISQSIATAIGQAYTLTFDFSAFEGRVPEHAKLRVVVASIDQTFDGFYSTYQQLSIDFIADSLLTNLDFENAGGDRSFPHMDNVAVELTDFNGVPEPTSIALLLIGLSCACWSRRSVVARR